jgi:high-affinity Fe2+/Pb2+ permease
MTGFGLWGLCLWSAVDAGSPVPSTARPWAALGGTLVAVLTAVAMVRSGPSTSLSDQALLGLSLALGVALGVAGVVVAVRAFRDRASRGT